jgi:hypothetical protein
MFVEHSFFPAFHENLLHFIIVKQESKIREQKPE